MTNTETDIFGSLTYIQKNAFKIIWEVSCCNFLSKVVPIIDCSWGEKNINLCFGGSNWCPEVIQHRNSKQVNRRCAVYCSNAYFFVFFIYQHARFRANQCPWIHLCSAFPMQWGPTSKQWETLEQLILTVRSWWKMKLVRHTAALMEFSRWYLWGINPHKIKHTKTSSNHRSRNLC